MLSLSPTRSDPEYRANTISCGPKIIISIIITTTTNIFTGTWDASAAITYFSLTLAGSKCTEQVPDALQCGALSVPTESALSGHRQLVPVLCVAPGEHVCKHHNLKQHSTTKTEERNGRKIQRENPYCGDHNTQNKSPLSTTNPSQDQTHMMQVPFSSCCHGHTPHIHIQWPGWSLAPSPCSPVRYIL